MSAKNGKAAFKSPDDFNKSGKGDKVSNGVKKPNGKAAPPPPERKLEQEIPKHSTCLMDFEAAEILQTIQDHMVVLSQDPDIKLPLSFDMGLTYAKRGGNYGKPDTVKKLFEPLKKHGVSDVEICLIVNICPDSVDEVFALVPALKEIDFISFHLSQYKPLLPKMNQIREPLRFALVELSNLKQRLAIINAK